MINLKTGISEGNDNETCDICSKVIDECAPYIEIDLEHTAEGDEGCIWICRTCLKLASVMIEEA